MKTESAIIIPSQTPFVRPLRFRFRTITYYLRYLHEIWYTFSSTPPSIEILVLIQHQFIINQQYNVGGDDDNTEMKIR